MPHDGRASCQTVSATIEHFALWSRQCLGDDVPLLHPGQALLQSHVGIGQALMVDPHQMQDRGVQVTDMARLFHCGKAQFVRRANRLSSFDTRTGQPHRKAVPIVIASRFINTFTGGCTTKFTTPDQERFIP